MIIKNCICFSFLLSFLVSFGQSNTKLADDVVRNIEKRIDLEVNPGIVIVLMKLTGDKSLLST
jgi:hypothetical protein